MPGSRIWAAQDVERAPPPSAEPRRRRWLVLRPGFLAMVASVAAALAFGVGFVVFADKAMTRPEADGPRAEAIVAMTGGSSRISDAVALLGSGKGHRLLISGVNPMVGDREIARFVPGAAMLLSCCIDLDHRALNTLGNAMETAKWVRKHRFRSVLVVTSNYHMPRTMLELQRLLPDVELIAYPVQSEASRIAAWWKDGPSVKILGLEYAKYLMAALRLRLDVPTAEPRRTARATSS